jgi:hypothetical protein
MQSGELQVNFQAFMEAPWVNRILPCFSTPSILLRLNRFEKGKTELGVFVYFESLTEFDPFIVHVSFFTVLLVLPGTTLLLERWIPISLKGLAR